MSPAIGQPRDGVSMPPRPASGASEGNGPSAMNNSVASPGPGPGYGPSPGQPNMGPPPHMYKGHGPPPPGQGVPPYGPGPHGYPGYPGQRPGYGPGPYGPNPYGPRPGGQYPGYPPQGPGQYPGSPGWNGPNAPPGKGGPPPPGQPGGPPPGHPGMRMGGPGAGPPAGYGGQSPYPGGPPSSYNGPGYPPGYPPAPGQYPGPVGPPGPPNGPPSSVPVSDSDNNASGDRQKPVKSVETTGPDGQPIHDESSQQSTLSQSSDNSGGRQTPKGNYPQVNTVLVFIFFFHTRVPATLPCCVSRADVTLCLGLLTRTRHASQRALTWQHGIISG